MTCTAAGWLFLFWHGNLQNGRGTNLTLKDAGGPKVLTGQEIACHFSQDHTVVTKILDFIHKHPNLKVVESFFHYLDRFFRNLAKTDEKLQFFWSKNREIKFFIFL